MLLRAALVVALLVACVLPATAEPPFRVLSEDASVRQCLEGRCATLQVSRSTFSTGEVETILFFSAFDEFGNPIPVFPFPFNRIDSEHFVMNKQGTRATLNYLGASVTWEANDDFHLVSTSTDILTQRTAAGLTRHRLVEKAHRFGADAEGMGGPVVFNTTQIPQAGDFISAFLTIGRTLSRTRLLDD